MLTPNRVVHFVGMSSEHLKKLMKVTNFQEIRILVGVWRVVCTQVFYSFKCQMRGGHFADSYQKSKKCPNWGQTPRDCKICEHLICSQKRILRQFGHMIIYSDCFGAD